ncbi:adenylate/guanylate cyclase domain-containing protein [Mesorhizobium sp. M1C.F.Ca.ET.193.01.1.1]|uniref:adenylate/guanylate cyclase domain-containing protein n=1 Tax=unclassified Mesorhizobium TaxID=325217 RepID=UPI000FD380ED|nr:MULTISPECIES: adenylate/guanylate cyclase domain-containing protein [unclassified Mesorhizobium]TGT03459.1 adenylate/guanylate cyclase domain-containing protein [bacterium M00.F.Ca.ET.177.01.1.1]TGQ56142.1 adenylate/guanylate cyclase domain-containing protein [Mesorhizobium sp. M1C.F.Ca.ET.210.01.1.1]TGQ75227.1 adenylate/guanylate cyclase domain-containing protein [Mesorhizobium sp. M1C.F.Ca.ET.212.01.1.1]TGR13639.1 adenylate/guanylate cyclase domain-containing protein [Mesorhizobium sp. M1C
MAERNYTRQLATIISIDAVGFSRLMGIDDERAVAAFEERRDIITDSCGTFGGRTFGVAGDSIMAEFGNPIEALRAAFDFQDRIMALNASAAEEMRMPFRAGINTGDVIVREGRLYGDDVNIAARLQEFAPHDGLAISETTWHHVKDKTAAVFIDLGEFMLKNIALPVRVLIAGRGGNGAAMAAPLAAMSTASGHYKPVPKGPPAIAVLPFQGEGSEPDVGYMADGVAEDIIYGLSNTRWLSVIAKGSSFQFRDDSLGTRLIGNALGARYIVSGTLTGLGGQIRLNASLTDTSNGRLVWSQRFDRDLVDIFSLRDQIGSEIVSILDKEVDRAEQVRTFQVPWESLETWQLVRRGRWHMNRRTRKDTEIALEFFDKAYREDPNSSAVLNELAWWYFWRAWLRFGDSDDLDKVEAFARKALLMDSLDARPHAYLGAADIMRGLPASAAEHLIEAIHINPSFAFARSAMGSARLLLGDAAGAIPFFLDTERLSPFDLYRFHNLGELAAAYCLVEDWPAAIAVADRSLNLSPGYFYARFLKIGALMRSGRRDEARRELAIFATRHPDFSEQRIRWIPFADPAKNKFLIANFDLAKSIA